VTIPLSGPISFTLTIPGNGKPATILQERKLNVPKVSQPQSEQTTEVASSSISSTSSSSSLEISSENAKQFTKEKIDYLPREEDDHQSNERRMPHHPSPKSQPREKIDYIYSKEVSESYEGPEYESPLYSSAVIRNDRRRADYLSPREQEQDEASSRSDEYSPYHPRPRISPADLRSLLKEPYSSSEKIQQDETSSVEPEEAPPMASPIPVRSTYKKPRKDWDTLRREERRKSLSALVQRLMHEQDY
jgi:hypothetical protein